MCLYASSSLLFSLALRFSNNWSVTACSFFSFSEIDSSAEPWEDFELVKTVKSFIQVEMSSFLISSGLIIPSSAPLCLYLLGIVRVHIFGVNVNCVKGLESHESFIK